MSRAVAVTGVGVVSAFGLGVEPFWDGLVAGRTGCLPARRVEAPGVLVAEVERLEARDFVRSPQGRRIDRTSLLALAATRLALADAGLVADGLDRARTALGLGSAFGNVQETEAFLDRILERGTGNPFVFPNLVMNAPLSYAAIELGVTGPTAMVTEQEASGEAAIAWGARQVADGAAEVCLAGGSDELTSGSAARPAPPAPGRRARSTRQPTARAWVRAPPCSSSKPWKGRARGTPASMRASRRTTAPASPVRSTAGRAMGGHWPASWPRWSREPMPSSPQRAAPPRWTRWRRRRSPSHAPAGASR
jgi:Beta-ketoacyl synthase, N-terminal domain